jgi:hypothetical protein
MKDTIVSQLEHTDDASDQVLFCPDHRAADMTLALPGVALAYGERDAINDCESHIRSEYRITDLRDATAERLNDVALHFKVQGLAKVDGDKYPCTCEVRNRHVTAAE